MSWGTVIKTVKIKILRQLPQQDDLVVTFTLGEAHRLQFEMVLVEFLMFCDSNGAMIIVEDVFDPDTAVKEGINIRISGQQQLYAHQLQARAPKFKACTISAW